MAKSIPAAVFLLVLLIAGVRDLSGGRAAVRQPDLGRRNAQLLNVDGLQFKDLARTGMLEPYEDWRLPADVRADDLVRKLSLEEAAGLMVHGTLPSANGPLRTLGNGTSYDLPRVRGLIQQHHVSSFISRLNTEAELFAHENNQVQEIAEASHWGIPVTISSDPRHHFQQVLGASAQDQAFSTWPEPLGFAAINDPELTRRFADVVRQEYLAVGLRESLAPQADLASEPRWPRINGTFGADPAIARRMVQAYVAGIQNGETGLNSGSVAAVVKHWVGYGASKDGWDAHNYYGRFASFPGNTFSQHLIPFEGAFASKAAGVMPTYAILEGVEIDGKPLEQVGAGFNQQLLRGLLRQKYGFAGIVLSDWAITNDCPEHCRNGADPGTEPNPADIGMPWGVEDLSKEQRFAKAILAGVDQIGGTDEAEIILEDVHKGLIPEERVREAARRILLQKFQQGLFEQPYVDEARAKSIAGNADFVRDGRAAQASAVVLLQNKAIAKKPLLPLAAGKKVYLYGLTAETAEAAGFQVVTDAKQADVAIIHAPAPYESEHKNYFFGSRQHEGRLEFELKDPAYLELLRVSSTTPTVFVTTLERPIILSNVLPHAAAVLGDFGIADDMLLAALTGKVHPRGRLPFALPSSEEAVRNRSVSEKPLFPLGFAQTF